YTILPTQAITPFLPYTTLFRSGGDRQDRGLPTPRRPPDADGAGPEVSSGDSDRQGYICRSGAFGWRRPLCAVIVSGPYGLSLCADRKSTRLNSSHVKIAYAVFC